MSPVRCCRRGGGMKVTLEGESWWSGNKVVVTGRCSLSQSSSRRKQVVVVVHLCGRLARKS